MCIDLIFIFLYSFYVSSCVCARAPYFITLKFTVRAHTNTHTRMNGRKQPLQKWESASRACVCVCVHNLTSLFTTAYILVILFLYINNIIRVYTTTNSACNYLLGGGGRPVNNNNNAPRSTSTTRERTRRRWKILVLDTRKNNKTKKKKNVNSSYSCIIRY